MVGQSRLLTHAVHGAVQTLLQGAQQVGMQGLGMTPAEHLETIDPFTQYFKTLWHHPGLSRFFVAPREAVLKRSWRCVLGGVGGVVGGGRKHECGQGIGGGEGCEGVRGMCEGRRDVGCWKAQGLRAGDVSVLTCSPNFFIAPQTYDLWLLELLLASPCA